MVTVLISIVYRASVKLSICIVHYYQEDSLVRLLESLDSYRPDCRFEVLIIDNGSESGLRSLSNRFGDWVRIITSETNVGFGRGQNKAVQKAKGEYVLICNPDIEFEDGSLDQLLTYAEELGDFGVIGPQLIYADGMVQDSYRRFPKPLDLVSNRMGRLPHFKQRRNQYLMADKDPNHVEEVDWLVGAVLLMKRADFLELGGFDERFFLFFEDTDLCRRLAASGKKVWYFPPSVMLHSRKRLSERGFWPLKKVFWIHLHSAAKYFWKWRRAN